MGIYVIFTIISPLIENKEVFDVNNINLEEYTTTQTSTAVNQTSMNERIEELYIEELEKDITKKIEEKGYKVITCKVNANISGEEESKINKIKLKIELSDEEKNQEEDSDIDKENDIEDRIVTQIQKIKPIDTSISKENTEKEGKTEQKTKIGNADIQNIKKFLIEEYGVSEKCLEIN